ncbi:MAG: hypothetical protein ACTH3S_05025 [Marinobacter sp.]|uniref:hypothetical protein n=1 Tax=Marinobacter sp. TaxID=50741 RepID=UPI003F960E03
MSKLGLLNLSTIDQLKRMLKVADPDSGYVHPGYQAMGLHVDDMEAQHAIGNRQGEVLETWEGIGFKKKRRKGAFKASGLKIVETAQLNWTRFNLPSKPEKLRDRLNSELDNVRFRMTYTPPA